MYLAHRPVITVNKICKTYDILRSECTGTIGDPKPARTSPYDGTEPVILLRPEDMHARVKIDSSFDPWYYSTPGTMLF